VRFYSDIDIPRQRIIVTFIRDVTLYDITEMVSTSGAAGVLHFRLLADARDARFVIAPEEIQPFQELIRQLATRSRLGQTAVWVADEKDLAMVEILAEKAAEFCDVKGFLNRAEAEQWLGWKSD
jgi:hypothetical protein